MHELLPGGTIAQALAQEWVELEGACKGASLSQTMIYVRTAVARAMALGQTVFLLTLRDKGHLRGVWMLARDANLLRSTVRPLSSGINEEYSWPLLLLDREKELAARMVNLALQIRADRLILYNLPANGAVDYVVNRSNYYQNVHRIEGFRLNSQRFPNFHSLKPYISSKLRSELARNVRNLERHHGSVTIGWCQNVSDTETALDWFMATKRADLDIRQVSSPWVGRSDVSNFFKTLAQALDLQHAPIVATLKVKGSIVSAAICLTGERTVEYFSTTYDRSFARLSPGKLLEYWLIEWALDHGRDFDYRIMRSWYKERAPVDQQTYHTRFVALTVKGRIKEFAEYRRIVLTELGRLRRKLFAG